MFINFSDCKVNVSWRQYIIYKGKNYILLQLLTQMTPAGKDKRHGHFFV